MSAEWFLGFFLTYDRIKNHMLIYCIFSMKISKISDEHFSNYNMLPNGNEEIDLFDLIRVL